MKYLLLIAFFFIVSQSYSQGPWVYEKGDGYSHVSISTLANYDKVFEGDFTKLVNIGGRITEITSQSYSEFGLGKKFGLTLSVPVVYVNSIVDESILVDRASGSLLGFGNSEIGLKYNLIDKSILLTAMLNIGLPIGRSDETTGLQTAYDSWSFTPIISMGNGMNKSYVYTYLAFEYNTNGFNHNGRFGIEYGHKFFSKLWTIFSFNLEEPLVVFNKEFESSFLQTRLFINDQYYNSFALKLIYEINDKTGINGSANLISVRANNLPFQSPLAIGFYKKW